MQTARYSRIPFEVDAVQVTLENMGEIANWCDGNLVAATDGGDERHVKVPVENVINDKQTKAFVGDWVLRSGKGFKVYTNKAFKKVFTAVDGTQELRTVNEAATG